jgi:hypothetical protein
MQNLDGVLGFLLFLGGTVATVLAAVLPFVWFAGRETRRKEEMRHLERMRMIEMGLTPRPGANRKARCRTAAAGDDGDDGPVDRLGLARRCLGAPAWIAFWGFLFGRPFGSGTHPSIGLAFLATIGVISVAALAAGAWIATRGEELPSWIPGPPSHDARANKPAFDPDTYDTVGRRG